MIITGSVLRKVYKKRDKWSKKGDFGRVLVIGGSLLYTGSPVFNALGAYRAGADLVTIVCPQRIVETVRSFTPDIIAYPYDEDFLSLNNNHIVEDAARASDVIIIGGGLTRMNATKEAIKKIIYTIKKPMIIDADAIYCIDKKLRENCIVTPHAHEFFVLTGKKVDNKINERIKLTKEASKKFGCTILLKGHIDVISDGKKTAINKTGTPFMTKGGFGDVLAGICGATLCRMQENAFTAACAGAYISGKAGEKAAKKKNEGTMASDLINEIPAVLANI